MKKSFSQKFWEDSHGKVVVWQKPNIWLMSWFITMILGWFVPAGFIQKTLGWISLAALVIWALLEIKDGVNYFRRTVGLLVILLLILSHVLPIL